MSPETEFGLGVVLENLDDVKLVVVLSYVCFIQGCTKYLITLGENME